LTTAERRSLNCTDIGDGNDTGDNDDDDDDTDDTGDKDDDDHVDDKDGGGGGDVIVSDAMPMRKAARVDADRKEREDDNDDDDDGGGDDEEEDGIDDDWDGDDGDVVVVIVPFFEAFVFEETSSACRPRSDASASTRWCHGAPAMDASVRAYAANRSVIACVLFANAASGASEA
jgi:hypothetical protein